jgi:hypothetical protein
VSAEKTGVTGSDGVNVNHEADDVLSGRDSFGVPGLSRFAFDVVTTRNPCPQS